MVMVAVMGHQRLGYSGGKLGLSSVDLDNEIGELCLFWTVERACVDLLNILGSKMETSGDFPMPTGGPTCDTLPGAYSRRTDEQTGP